MTDVVIIGAGTAGFSAAIYAVRAGLSVRLLESGLYGGQIVNSPEVDNYPGLPGLSGFDFVQKLAEHGKKFGVKPETVRLTGVDFSGTEKRLFAGEEVIPCRTVIIATGASPRKLGCPGEAELTGRGVSYCAACDGMFFKGKTVAVNGGGNTALEDAIFLSNVCEKVYLIHRREEFRAEKALTQAAAARENIVPLLSRTVSAIHGEKAVTGLVLKDASGKEEDLAVNGLFIAIGHQPNTSLFSGHVELENGYIKAGEDCCTNVPGVFAAGDVRTKGVRQLVTAAADGAVAGIAAGKYLL